MTRPAGIHPVQHILYQSGEYLNGLEAVCSLGDCDRELADGSESQVRDTSSVLPVHITLVADS